MPLIDPSTGSKAPLSRRVILSPLIMVRGFPFTAAILVALALAFPGHENLHSLCLGGAFGILIGCTVFSFSIKSIRLKQGEQPSNVARYPWS